MQSLGKALESHTTNLTNSVSDGEDYICPICEKVVPKLAVHIFGAARIVQPKCRCETEKFIHERNKSNEEEIKRQIERKFSISNLGERFAECKFDTFAFRPGTEKVVSNAKAYAEHFEQMIPDGLLIWGIPGNGKSHLAAAIAHEVKANKKTVVFQTVPELLERIRNTFNNRNTESEREIMDALLYCDLLVLDDIGAEKVTGWVLEVLYRIVDGRYRKKKPIVYTTNLKPSELKDQLVDVNGIDRIYDRMVETSIIIENKGTSYRREIARNRLGQLRDGKSHE